MRAVYAEQPYSIGLREIPVPEPGENEVLIKVAYAGVCGSDLHAYRGEHAFRKPPVMLGHEMSGFICKMGEKVSGFQPGQPVTVMPQISCGKCESCLKGNVHHCAHKILPAMPGWRGLGTFGDYFVAPAEVVCPLGDVPLDLGALTEPLAVATHLMSRIPSGHGKDLVIIGAGTIGLLLLIIAPDYGFEHILITDILDDNLALARELGAAVTVNVARESALEAVHETFGELGCETVLVAAGGPDILEQAMEMSRPGANILFVAMITSPSTFVSYPIVYKELSILGSFNYVMKDFESAVHFLHTRGDQMRKIVTHVMPLDQAAEAFRIQDEKKEFAVKILLEVNP